MLDPSSRKSRDKIYTGTQKMLTGETTLKVTLRVSSRGVGVGERWGLEAEWWRSGGWGTGEGHGGLGTEAERST